MHLVVEAPVGVSLGRELVAAAHQSPLSTLVQARSQRSVLVLAVLAAQEAHVRRKSAATPKSRLQAQQLRAAAAAPRSAEPVLEVPLT